MNDEMQSSWLIQRLSKPHPANSIFGKDNPFSFGGGLKNGGLRDEAMDLLRGIFSFDYMGAAEFEWGAVPKALDRMARAHTNLIATEVAVDLSTLAPDWQTRATYSGEGTVYVICQETHLEEVASRIRMWAQEGYQARLKEATHLDSALRPDKPDWIDTCGWLELDNGFLFFTEAEMFQKAADLFGVKVAEAA